MFLISKLITSIILPPGSIIALFFLLFLFRLRTLLKWNKLFFILYAAILTGFYLISIEPVSEALIRPLEEFQNVELSSERNPDLIIVLGGGSTIHSGKKGELSCEVSSTTKDRVLEGIILGKEKQLPLLFTGGNVLKGINAPGEADAVGVLFSRLGMDSTAYQLEKRSRNTFENAMYSSDMTDKKNIILVTSAFHSKRSYLCFKKAGFDIMEIRAVDSRIDDKPFSILELIPSMGALQNSSTALHEYFGLLYYKLFYGI